MTNRILAVEKAIDASSISDKQAAYQAYISKALGKSNQDAREIAADIIGKPVFWDWDRKRINTVNCDKSSFVHVSVPRTIEGYYHFTGGVEVCIAVYALEQVG